eukprot:Em0015g934a
MSAGRVLELSCPHPQPTSRCADRPACCKVLVTTLRRVLCLVVLSPLTVVTQRVKEKCATPKTLLKALVDVSAVDLYVAFSILRMCGSYCKLVHLARATPPSHCADYLKLFDEEVRLCFTSCIAVDVPDLSWQQAQLSPSLGGLGFRSLALHSSAAFIASFASSGFCSPDNIHMLQAVTRFNAQVHPLESTTAEAVLACPPLQRALSKKLDNHAFQSLLSSSSQVNKARILSASAPHAGSWISATPSTGLDLHLDSAECQVALRWWLGLDTSGGSLCPLCPDTALDPLGHHATTCRHGGDVVARHNRLRDIFANFCRRAHLSVQVEVGYGLARDHINSRPADILVQGWDRGKPAAFDVTVTSPLTPVSLNNASASMGAAAYAAECRKHAANDTRCQELGWLCIPLAVETQAILKPKMLSEIYSRLNMSLVRSVARAIMGREAAQGVLLRLCGAFCKLVHLARATPSTLTSKVFALINDDIQMTFCRCIGVDMSDTAWQQAQLSPSRGGLGFWSLSRHSSAAFISSLCSSGFGLQSSHHLSQAIETFNSLVSPADAVSVESLLTSSVSQKYLSGKLDDRVFNILLNSSSVADKARLLSVSSPHAASWLSVVPSENLGLHLDPPVFQVAIKWWLGLDTSEGSQCALCPGSTLDHLGHHAVTCKYGGDVVSRHNRIRDILVETCRRAHIGVKVEVGNNLSRDHSKTRPADILLPNWFLGRTAALDVSITSPLNPVTLLEAGVSATAAAQATEARKHQANDPKCSELAGPVPAALSEPTTSSLPSLEAVCELKSPTLRFVPKKARPAFAKVLSSVLRSILSENTAEAWLRLFMLPQCVLPSLKCKGRHSRPTPIESLCERWSRNELESLWRQAKENSRSNPTRQDADFKQSLYSAITLARLGMYGKACRMLLSDGIAPHNDTTWELLKAKHPSCTPPSAPASEPSSPPPSMGPEFNIAAILQSFPRGTSAGPSGLRVQHLLDVVGIPLPSPLCVSLKSVVNLLASGKVPSEVSRYLAGGNLTALKKIKPNSPPDIRPIAVGETLRRLTGKCLCALVKEKASDFFQPLQLGVACASGTEKIVHGLRRCVEDHWLDNDFAVIKSDMKNAFNLVSREALLLECSNLFPELLPWATWCYGSQPFFFHSLGILTSESGVQQGDPLGPLFFALVLHRIVSLIDADDDCVITLNS